MGCSQRLKRHSSKRQLRGVTMPQRRRLHHGWTWVTPLRRQAFCEKSNDHGANACEHHMQLFATVQSLSLALVACTSRKCVCVDNSWWQLVRAFLGIVEKWFWRLSVGAMRTLKWGENVDMLRLRSKSPKFWPKTLGTDTSTETISPDF